jgi:Putative Ig domain
MKLKLTRSLMFALALLGSSAAQQGAATGEPIVFATAPLPKGFLRQPYHFKLEAQGGITPLKWEVTNGSPPEGIQLAPDGTLSGAPTEVDSFHFVVTVTDNGRPVAQRKKEFVLEVVTPLVVEWSKKPKITGHRLEAAIRVSNQTGDDFDFTFIALAVNENGRATAVGYQHFTLKKDTDEFEIPFGENLPQGAYDLHVDAVGEVASTNTIFRARLAPADKLQVVQGP